MASRKQVNKISSEMAETVGHLLNKCRGIIMEAQGDKFDTSESRGSTGWDAKDEGDFWTFINSLCENSRTSIIN